MKALQFLKKPEVTLLALMFANILLFWGSKQKDIGKTAGISRTKMHEPIALKKPAFSHFSETEE